VVDLRMNHLDPSPPVAIDNAPMSRDAFDALYHHPGYTYEYMHGRVQISVADSALAVVVARTADLESLSEEHASPRSISFSPVHEESQSDVAEAWVEAFIHVPEFYGYPLAYLRQRADEQLGSLRKQQKLSPQPASLVLKDEERIVGLILVTTTSTRPLIDAVFIVQRLQRRGLGRLLLRRVGARLRAAGVDLLCSTYHLANQQSAAWYSALGFKEMPCSLLAARRYRCAAHNLRQGWARDALCARCHVEWLRDRRDALRAATREDTLAANPIAWLSSDGDRIDRFAEEAWSDVDDTSRSRG